MKQIQGAMEIINSRMDRNGNRYWAFRFAQIGTGEVVRGTISGGESNLESAAYHLAGEDWEERRKNIVVSRQELPIREFNRYTKGLPYAGCRSEDIAKYIVDNLK